MRNAVVFWMTWLLVTFLLGTPTEARAGNDRSFFLGNEAAMTGGSVLAWGTDGGMLWYNPAGLGGNEHNRIELSGTAFVLRIRRIDEALVNQLPTEEAVGSFSGTDLLSVPSALVLLHRLRDGLTLGVGAFVVEQESITVDTEIVQAEASTFVGSLEGDFRRVRYDFGIGLGARLSSRMRIGTSLFLGYDQQTQHGRYGAHYRQDEAPTAEIVGTRSLSDSRKRLSGQLVFGIQWNPVGRLHLGAAIRSPRFAFASTQTREDLTTAGAQLEGFSEPILRFDMDTDPGALPSPFTPLSALQFSVGVAYALEHGLLVAEGEISHRLENDEVQLDRSWNVRFGGRFNVGETTALGFGLFTDRNASRPNDRYPEFELDFYGASFGVEWTKDIELGEREDSRALRLSTTLSLRYAVGIGEASQIVVDATSLGSTVDVSLQARTDALVHDTGLHIGSGLHF